MSPTKAKLSRFLYCQLPHRLTYWGEVVQVPCHPSCHQQRQNCHALFTVSCLTVSPTGVKLSKFLAIHHVTNKGKTVTLSLLSVVSPTGVKLSKFFAIHHVTHKGKAVRVSLLPVVTPTRVKLSKLLAINNATHKENNTFFFFPHTVAPCMLI